MTQSLCKLARSAVAVLVLATLSPLPARADFFDNMRQTFQTDIPHFFKNDVPHFFQDDIPCAFGGQPTSKTRTSCKSPEHPQPPPVQPTDPATAPPDKSTEVHDAPAAAEH